MNTAALVLAVALSSNASGKTLVRQQPGTVVPVTSACRTVICNQGPVTAHVYFDGTQIKDAKGNAWAMNGTVPQVARSGSTPPGAGPFSDANFYSLGTGSDVLDFSGDFSICGILSPSAGDFTIAGVGGVWFSNGTYGSSGYFSGFNTSAQATSIASQTSVLASANATAAGRLSVVCWGRSGSSQVVKMNLGAYGSAAQTYTPGTSVVARLGRYSATGQYVTGTIYEVWFSSQTPSDALFTSIQQQVKSKLGITAW